MYLITSFFLKMNARKKQPVMVYLVEKVAYSSMAKALIVATTVDDLSALKLIAQSIILTLIGGHGGILYGEKLLYCI